MAKEHQKLAIAALQTTSACRPESTAEDTYTATQTTSFLYAMRSLVYLRERGTRADGTLVWVDREGQPAPPIQSGSLYHPRVSPDGRMVTYVDWCDKGDLAIRDLATGENRRLTHTADGGANAAGNSRVSPDGKQVVYGWDRELRLLPVSLLVVLLDIFLVIRREPGIGLCELILSVSHAGR